MAEWHQQNGKHWDIYWVKSAICFHSSINFACVAPPCIWFTLWINDEHLLSTAQFGMAATISCHASCVTPYKPNHFIRSMLWHSSGTMSDKVEMSKMGGALPLLSILVRLVSFFFCKRFHSLKCKWWTIVTAINSELFHKRHQILIFK